MPRDLPSITLLRSLFVYDHRTGTLLWKVNRGTNKVQGDIAGKLNSLGRRQVRVQSRLFLVSRICWAMYYGNWPSSYLDHINGDPEDNRINNLREVSHQDNMKNKGLYKNSTSGVAGVYLKNGKWVAKITCASTQKHLGVFPTKELAVAARKEAEHSMFGVFNRGHL